MDARAAAAARRAKILERASNRLSVAKGEATGDAPAATDEASASASGSEEVTSDQSGEVQTAATLTAESSPAQSPSAAPFRPLAARRNLVKGSAPSTPVVASEDVKSSSSSSGSSTKEGGDDSTQSTLSFAQEGEEDIATRQEVKQEKEATSDAAAESGKSEEQDSAAGSEGDATPAPIISPTIRQVEQEIAKITEDAADAINPSESSAQKKASRPLADRRNKIKGIASPEPQAGTKQTSSAISANSIENEAIVNSALAKAGFVPLRQAVIMKFARLVVIIAVAVAVGYQSSLSSAPLINSSPVFADSPTIAPILQLGTALSTLFSSNSNSSSAGTSEASDDATSQLSAFIARVEASGVHLTRSSSGVAENAASAAANLGIKINSGIFETSIFAVLVVWFVSGMSSQYISAKFGAAGKDAEKDKNIVSTIFSFLTTGLEGSFCDSAFFTTLFLDSQPFLFPQLSSYTNPSALKESVLSYLGEIALHWVVVIGVSMAVSAAFKNGIAQPTQQASSDAISMSGGGGGEL